MDDVTVLQNHLSTVGSSQHSGIHHRSGQVVGANYLVGEPPPKCWIEGAEQAIAEIGFCSRPNRVDVRRAEDVQAGESCCRQCILGLALVPCERHPAPPRRTRPIPAQQSERPIGAAPAKHSPDLTPLAPCDPPQAPIPPPPRTPAHAPNA